MANSIRRFFISADFYKSVTFLIAALFPILIGNFFYDNVTVGFAIALGVLYNSPSNIAGSVKHRTVGMLICILISTLTTLILGYASVHTGMLLPILGLITFVVSYISVFGHRASLVALGGLLSIVLSFTHDYLKMPVWEYGLLVGFGGIWYLFIVSLFNYLNPRLYVEELLSDTLNITAKYLKVRAKLLVETDKREELHKELFEHQAKLTEKHETLREVIFSSRNKEGYSHRNRRMLLIFIELVEIFELAIANPVNYTKIDEIFKNKTKYITPFVDLINEMALQLDYVSLELIRHEKPKGSSQIRVLLKKIRASIDAYKNDIFTDESREGFHMLVNLFEYQENQSLKINAIERVLNTLITNNSLISDKKEETRFLTTTDYDFNKLRENFNFKSPTFKHSLRLSIAMIAGYIIGISFHFQNPYWILITLVVILRPSYGLTKERMIHRIVGTIIGGAIALAVVYVVQNTFFLGFLAALSLALALALVQQNYRNFAIFLTLHIVFLYAIYSDNVIEAVQFRVIDTLVGAALAIVANLFLFPSWEFMSIDESMAEVINSNAEYLRQIDIRYHNKKPITVEYKLSRKKAFLSVGELNLAFQRMSQEPKSRQKYSREIYKIVVLNNTFLSSLASLGTFIRTHKTTAVSKSVEVFIANITNNLKNAENKLNQELEVHQVSTDEVEDATLALEKKYRELTRNYDKIELNSSESIEKRENIALEIQETKLVLEQLSYLFNLSKSIVQQVQLYQHNKKIKQA